MPLESKMVNGGWEQSLADYLDRSIERTVFESIVDGYERWRQEEFHSYDHLEDSYTLRLVDNIHKALREQNNTFLEVRSQNAEYTPAMYAGRASSRTAGKSDVVFSLRNRFVNRYSFLSIECKRLESDNSWYKKYVMDGMQRFIRGKYGAASRIGAMVGYVVEITLDEIPGRINTQIEEHLDGESNQRLVSSGLIRESTVVYESNHVRDSPPGGQIRLIHLFFDMDGIEHVGENSLPLL